MVCIPTGVTSVEKRAVLEATMQAGASKTYLIEEPLAAALGAGLDIAAELAVWLSISAAELLILPY